MKKMKRWGLLALLTILFAQSKLSAQEKLEGRWDLTVDMGDRMAPSWLEVRHSGIKTLFGRFVADGGSARPIAEVFFADNKLHFSIPPQWDRAEKYLEVAAELKDDKLTGTMISSSGKKYTWTGVRAPSLWRGKEPVWDKPIKLFNGVNLDGWEAMGKTNQWVAENGVLKSPRSGSNIRTKDNFNDFKLHIEFRYPKESNSGVYLRGRYEVQIEDNKGMEPMSLYFGGIYGFIDPWLNMAKDPGEWQTYDITLAGRMVTVVANGKTIIYKEQIPGITGGAINSDEGAPGPIMLQGDHGPIEFRNIVLTPAK